MSVPADQQRLLAVLATAIAESPVNLVSAADRSRTPAHLEDALSALRHLPASASRVIVDVGSGGGIPGLVAAIVAPGARVHLIDSVQRKARFLRDTAVHLQMDDRVVVHEGRAEDLARGELRDIADLVTARALASPVSALEWMAPFARPGGTVAYMTTSDVDMHALFTACEQLALGPPSLLETPSTLRATGAIVTAQKLAPTPPAFPRKTGLARRRPLA